MPSDTRARFGGGRGAQSSPTARPPRRHYTSSSSLSSSPLCGLASSSSSTAVATTAFRRLAPSSDSNDRDSDRELNGRAAPICLDAFLIDIRFAGFAGWSAGSFIASSDRAAAIFFDAFLIDVGLSEDLFIESARSGIWGEHGKSEQTETAARGQRRMWESGGGGGGTAVLAAMRWQL